MIDYLDDLDFFPSKSFSRKPYNSQEARKLSRYSKSELRAKYSEKVPKIKGFLPKNKMIQLILNEVV